jgi:formamidopyrimidine-DNA glycosylase
VPEGPEVKIISNVFHDIRNKKVQEAVIIENVPGTHHRYSRQKPNNWDIITKPFYPKDVRTKGKLISLNICQDNYDTERHWTLLFTLGMSGDFQRNAITHKHCRYAFKFEDGTDLSFIDTRCFGTIRIVKPSEAAKLEKKIGWDLLEAPMPDDDWHKLKLSSKISPLEVGDALLEQRHFSSIGNIYRAEILYRAGINPQTPIMLLTADQWKSINYTAHQLLQDAYKLNGCSVADFTANGKEGQAQQLLMVYGREKCPKGHQIITIPQSGRTMHFCAKCQPVVSSWVAG